MKKIESAVGEDHAPACGSSNRRRFEHGLERENPRDAHRSREA